MMGILNELGFRRAKLVGDLVEEWRIKHDQAMEARDVEELIAELIWLVGLVKRLWHEMVDDLYGGKIDDIDRAGRIMAALINAMETTLGAVHEQVRKVQACGHSVEGSDQFEAKINEIGQIKLGFEKKWPTVDQEMIDESLAAYKNGEYQSSEELLNAFPGGSSSDK